MSVRSLLLTAVLVGLPAQAMELEGYLPRVGDYDPAIPPPSSVLGFEVGDWHVRHDRLETYLRTLAGSSDRVTIEVTGRTHEGRNLLLLTVSSPENLQRLEELRLAHLAGVGDPRAEPGPLVVWQGFSVHGNEASGANASLLFAYHLAAARGPEVEEMLADTVVLIDPSLNPDGLDRFATWANGHRGRTLVADPEHREHNEVWPGGRTNHYWFDLNRDWLLLVHPESRARVAQFQRWRPHVLTDLHEMGRNATFFFQPGVPGRTHPLTPPANVELTAKLGRYHARALDRLGERYYTEETFDDFYYGKGSTYPDVNGSVGILFEQGSVRGHRVETDHGTRDFAEAVRNQLTVARSTLEGAWALQDELRDYQRRFYADARREAGQSRVRGYLLGDGGDPARAARLLSILHQHGIEAYELAQETRAEGYTFRPGHAWVLPTRQTQARLLRAMMERRTEFEDETFYDVSTWTLPLAFDLPSAELVEGLADEMLGDAVDEIRLAGRFQSRPDAVAYAFDWASYFAPRALQRLLDAGARVYAAKRPLMLPTPEGEVAFGRGSIVVPLGQAYPAESLQKLFETIVREDAITVRAVTTGLTARGIDLGSPNLRRVEPVRPLLVVGDGVSGYEAGEVWHLLDTRVGLPLTMVEAPRLHGVDLRGYTHVLLVDGRYSGLGEAAVEDLRRWVAAGGILVASKRAAVWVTEQRLYSSEAAQESSADRRPGSKAGSEPPARTAIDPEPAGGAAAAPDAAERFRPYEEFASDRAETIVSGAIVEVVIDVTHPLAYGFRQPRLPVFRNGTVLLEPGENPYENIARYADEPLLSGYMSAKRQNELRGHASLIANRVRDGLVVRMAENPNFRGIWYGTNRLYLDALFFGQLVDATRLDRAR